MGPVTHAGLPARPRCMCNHLASRSHHRTTVPPHHHVTTPPQVKMLEAEREYECTNPKCNFRFKVQASLEQDNTMEMPVRTPVPSNHSCTHSPEQRGGCRGHPSRSNAQAVAAVATVVAVVAGARASRARSVTSRSRVCASTTKR